MLYIDIQAACIHTLSRAHIITHIQIITPTHTHFVIYHTSTHTSIPLTTASHDPLGQASYCAQYGDEQRFCLTHVCVHVCVRELT